MSKNLKYQPQLGRRGGDERFFITEWDIFDLEKAQLPFRGVGSKKETPKTRD